MSVYDFSTFKNSSFSEPITYTVSGGSPISIRAVVFRKQPGTINAKADSSIVVYPVVAEIDRADVPVVTELEDSIVCNDITGESKTFRVKKILYSDEGCFKLGLL